MKDRFILTLSITAFLFLVAVGLYFGGAAGFPGTAQLRSVKTPPTVITQIYNRGASDFAVAIGKDGLPVVVYRGNGGGLEFLKCGNRACDVGNSSTIIESPIPTPYTNVKVPSDGLPVIAYFIYTNSPGGLIRAIRFVKCGNPACSSGNVTKRLDRDAQFPSASDLSMTLGADGLPVMTYMRTRLVEFPISDYHLQVLKCNDSLCSTYSVNVYDEVLRSDNWPGQPDIAIGKDGLPVIAYMYNKDQQPKTYLKVAKCGDSRCSSGNVLTIVDGSNTYHSTHPSIAVGSDGLPMISYVSYFSASGNGYLRGAKCGNSSCSSGNVLTDLDPGAKIFSGTQIAVVGKFPIIEYIKHAVDDYHPPILAILRCGNAACTSGNVITDVDQDSGQINYGKDTMTLHKAGNPVIVEHRDKTPGLLKLVACGNQYCK